VSIQCDSGDGENGKAFAESRSVAGSRECAEFIVKNCSKEAVPERVVIDSEIVTIKM